MYCNEHCLVFLSIVFFGLHLISDVLLQLKQDAGSPLNVTVGTHMMLLAHGQLVNNDSNADVTFVLIVNKKPETVFAHR